MKNNAFFLLLAALLFLGVSCNSTKTATEQAATTTKSATTNQRPERGNPEEMFAKMDANGDGKLSAAEVKGPLKEQFATIDTDKDGFISLEEMKKAPRPERQGPRGGGGRPN